MNSFLSDGLKIREKRPSTKRPSRGQSKSSWNNWRNPARLCAGEVFPATISSWVVRLLTKATGSVPALAGIVGVSAPASETTAVVKRERRNMGDSVGAYGGSMIGPFCAADLLADIRQISGGFEGRIAPLGKFAFNRANSLLYARH